MKFKLILLMLSWIFTMLMKGKLQINMQSGLLENTASLQDPND